MTDVKLPTREHKEDRFAPLKLQDVVEVKVDQLALCRNFEVIARALEKLTEMSGSVRNCEEEINNLKARTSRNEREIHTINKGMELRKQFDLNKIIQSIEEHQEKLETLQATSNRHTDEVTKLYDLAKYLDYEEIVRNIDGLQYFARLKETNETAANINAKLQETINSKMDTEKCQKELKKFVPHVQYKIFYDDTNRELIRLEKEKLSHYEFKKESEGVRAIQDRMSQINESFGKLNEKVEENYRFVLSIDLKEIDLKIRKSKEDLQYQLNSLKPAVNSKISSSELADFEKQINAKMETFLEQTFEAMAQKHETKKALIFLQRRINQVVKVLNRNSESPQKEEELDAMLTKTNPWHCASCSASIAKGSGRQSGFMPWSNFPLRQHITQKDRNFEAFLEKLALKRLSQPFLHKNNADEKLEMLADAIATVSERDNTDGSTTKTTNFMHTYGRSESRSMARIRSSKMMPSIDPKERKSEAKKPLNTDRP